jgi:hypothetical protein
MNQVRELLQQGCSHQSEQFDCYTFEDYNPLLDNNPDSRE